MQYISGCVCVDPGSDLSPVKDEIVTRRAETITMGTVYKRLIKPPKKDTIRFFFSIQIHVCKVSRGE